MADVIRSARNRALRQWLVRIEAGRKLSSQGVRETHSVETHTVSQDQFFDLLRSCFAPQIIWMSEQEDRISKLRGIETLGRTKQRVVDSFISVGHWPGRPHFSELCVHVSKG